MKLQISGPALAALLASCAANSQHSSTPQRAAQQAEEDKKSAHEDAREARQEAQKEQREAEEARKAEREADQKAQWATQRATLAEAQAASEAKVQPARSPGATERQADASGAVGASNTAVLFSVNSADLSPDARSSLDHLAATLRAQPQAHDVMARGYTDDAGPESSNVQLAQRRAEAVAEYLQSKGVPRDRIATKALGSLHPATPETTDRARTLNRRVEIVIQPAGKAR